MPAADANCFDGDGRYVDVRQIDHLEKLLESGQVQRDIDAILDNSTEMVWPFHSRTSRVPFEPVRAAAGQAGTIYVNSNASIAREVEWFRTAALRPFMTFKQALKTPTGCHSWRSVITVQAMSDQSAIVRPMSFTRRLPIGRVFGWVGR